VRRLCRKNRAAVLRRVKEPAQIFSRLADVFVHHGGQINTIQIQSQFVRNDLGGHRLARAAVPENRALMLKPRFIFR
jgi:hypothetical protein